MSFYCSILQSFLVMHRLRFLFAKTSFFVFCYSKCLNFPSVPSMIFSKSFLFKSFPRLLPYRMIDIMWFSVMIFIVYHLIFKSLKTVYCFRTIYFSIILFSIVCITIHFVRFYTALSVECPVLIDLNLPDV